VHVAVTDDLISRGVRAGDLVRQVAAASGGSGGGRPHFASGGLGQAGSPEERRRRVVEIVGAALGSGT
jgi:alanyl-tRNA synthetase